MARPVEIDGPTVERVATGEIGIEKIELWIEQRTRPQP
jgi:hypothetical protein